MNLPFSQQVERNFANALEHPFYGFAATPSISQCVDGCPGGFSYMAAVEIGLDANGDRDNSDRPVKGVNDLTKPILSPVDASGVAIRNGIPGSHKTLLDLRLQYVVRLQNQRTAGFFMEVYNALNHVNFGNVIGIRNSSQFGQSVVADTARQMQLGVRYTF